MKKILFLLLLSALLAFPLSALEQDHLDSLERAHELLKEAAVKAAQREVEITVRSVDIGEFPIIKMLIEAYNKLGEPLDSLNAQNVFVYEKGERRNIISVEKVPVSEEVAVDFVFVIDQTGSMQKYINAVMSNVSSFTNSLVRRGINYKLGLVLFSDEVEKVYQPTSSVVDFLSWLSGVKARGGGDEKENALEALETAAKSIKYRVEANRVAVLITDAPYHQVGEEDGYGVTNQNTNSIVKLLVESDVRVFCIVPPRLENYTIISRKTRGNFFDIDYPFSTILDNFSNQLTNLYYVKFRSEDKEVPDSIEIALLNPKLGKLVRKTIPIVELGRKLIIENLLYQSNSFELPDKVRELDILADFMKNKSDIKIIVEGHTDNVGSGPFNDVLSNQRAASVKRYLVSHGIADERISTVGYGKRKPIASNKDEFGRRLNRRTEIVIQSTK